MIVRVEVQQHATPDTYWQLARCQVQRGMFMEDVRDPALFRSMQFATLEETVRHAKRATFAYLQQVRHKKMPDHIDWRDHRRRPGSFPAPCVSSLSTKKPNWAALGAPLTSKTGDVQAARRPSHCGPMSWLVCARLRSHA